MSLGGGQSVCPRCAAPLIAAARCSLCGWERPAANGVGLPVWRAALDVAYGRNLLTPAVAAGVWCLPLEDGQIVALDAASGERLWARRLSEQAAALSIAAVEDLLLVGLADTRPIPSGQQPLLALRPRTGEVAWSFPTAGHSLSTAAVGQAIFFTSSDGRIHALGRDGQALWSRPHPTWGPAPPAIAGSLVVAGGRGETLAAYDAATGAPRWQFTAASWLAGDLVAAAGRLLTVAFDGTLYALDAERGTLLWQARGQRGKGFSSSPVVAGDRLLIGDRVHLEDGARAGGYALRALGLADGAELGRFTLPKRLQLAPTAARAGDGATLLICCADDGVCYALEPTSLAERWRYSGAQPFVAAPRPAGGLIILADEAGAVVALTLGAPAPPANAAADRSRRPPEVVNLMPRPEALDLPLTLIFNAPDPTGAVSISWKAEEIGEVTSSFQPPYAGDDLGLVIRALDELHTRQRGFAHDELSRLAGLGLVVSPDSGQLLYESHRAVGRRLYDALVSDREADKALAVIRNAAVAQRRQVIVHLHFAPRAVELATLPWELTWDNSGEPLLLSRGQMIACVRHLDLPQALPPARPGRRPLRLLAVIPSIGISPAVGAEEQARRRAALAPLVGGGDLVLDEISGRVTRQRLNDYLRVLAEPPDIIHFFGHGVYRDGQGYLVLDKEGVEGDPDPVPALLIARLFRDARLVVLHACQSAAVSEAGLLTGVAPALSAAGVPAVVAMQLMVRIPSAIRFAEILYSELSRGSSLHNAVSRGRDVLYTEGYGSEDESWYVPTLTVRTRDAGPIYL